VNRVQIRELVEFTGEKDDVVADTELEAISAGGGCSDWVNRDDSYVFNRGRSELYWVARYWFRAKMDEEGVQRYKVREEKFLSEQRRKLGWMSVSRHTGGAKARIMRGFRLTPLGQETVDRLIPFIEWGKNQDSTTQSNLWNFWRNETCLLILDEFERTGGFNYEDLRNKSDFSRSCSF